jgi:hypothetical protein
MFTALVVVQPVTQVCIRMMTPSICLRVVIGMNAQATSQSRSGLRKDRLDLEAVSNSMSNLD